MQYTHTQPHIILPTLGKNKSINKSLRAFRGSDDDLITRTDGRETAVKRGRLSGRARV